jgi:hypothetical protein
VLARPENFLSQKVYDYLFLLIVTKQINTNVLNYRKRQLRCDNVLEIATQQGFPTGQTPETNHPFKTRAPNGVFPGYLHLYINTLDKASFMNCYCNYPRKLTNTFIILTNTFLFIQRSKLIVSNTVLHSDSYR